MGTKDGNGFGNGWEPLVFCGHGATDYRNALQFDAGNGHGAPINCTGDGLNGGGKGNNPPERFREIDPGCGAVDF